MARARSRTAAATTECANRHELERWLERGSAAQRVRAAIVLERERGVALNVIAQRLGVHRDTVRRWLARYRRAGMAGLFHGNAGQERPRVFAAPVCDRIRQVAAAMPGDLGEPFAEWSLYKLRRYLVRAGVVTTISIERLRQILQETGERPASWRRPFPDRVALGVNTRQRLQRMALDPVLGRRAEIILAASEGRPVKAIAVDLGSSANTARRWIRRFVAGGISTLAASPVRGQAVVFTPVVCERIVAVAARCPRELGVDVERWSLYSLRRYLISQQIVERISIEWLRQIVRRATGSTRLPATAAVAAPPATEGSLPLPLRALARSTPGARPRSALGERSAAVPRGPRNQTHRAPRADSAR